MKKSIEQKRIGFHSIESIIKNNPHKIKKLFLNHGETYKRESLAVDTFDDLKRVEKFFL